MIIPLKTMAYFVIGSISLGAILSSCTSLPKGADTAPVVCTVIVSNPEYGAQIGFPVNSSTNIFSPGFELEITVNTLNSSNQASFYSTKTVQFNHTDIVRNISLSFRVDGIKLPSQGGYVIQYQLRSQNCTWAQTSGCYNNNFNGSASKKYFKDQRTIPSGNPGTINFFSNFSLKYTEICC